MSLAAFVLNNRRVYCTFQKEELKNEMKKKRLKRNMSQSNNSDFDTVDLIWLDATVYSSIENHATQKEFRSITHNFHSFDSNHDCEKYIQTKTIYDRLFLIVSGQLGRDIVPRIHHYRQIFSIYVYCQNKQKNEEWANKFSKVGYKFEFLPLIYSQLFLKRLKA